LLWPRTLGEKKKRGQGSGESAWVCGQLAIAISDFALPNTTHRGEERGKEYPHYLIILKKRKRGGEKGKRKRRFGPGVETDWIPLDKLLERKKKKKEREREGVALASIGENSTDRS